MAEELTEKALKQPGLSESFELPPELEFSSGEGLLEGVGELAAEILAEPWLQEKEVLALRTDPARVIRK